MLACADLGVSLHYSSSGLDLPMKAVDMLGCALPILSADFLCVRELIDDGKNGFLFENAEKLADLLILLLIDYPHSDFLNAIKRTCKNERKEKTGWVEAWDQISLPYIKRLIDNQ
uniref:Glycosyltransferase n=1 Tax=Romanomermis culicivorax TaxID=13658 RepID=A0A915HZH7_ROMCU